MSATRRGVDLTADELLHIYPSPIGTATIAASGATSNALDFGGQQATGIYMGTAWGGTAAVSFLASHDGTTYSDLYVYNGTAELFVSTSVVGANRFVVLDPDDWKGIRYVKVRSGRTASPVTQSGGAALVFVGRVL